MTLHQQATEKRHFIRMNLDTPAYIEISQAQPREEAICRNLSGNGLLLETKQSLRCGTHMRVTISNQRNIAPMISAHCVVNRVRSQSNSSTSSNSNKSYLIGAKIEEFL